MIKRRYIMSVEKWKRKTSKTTFLLEAYELNDAISSTITNMPTKYRNSYGDIVIKSGLEVLRLLYKANSIFVGPHTTKVEFQERRLLFNQGLAELNVTMMTLEIFLNHARKADGLNEEKIYKVLDRIGSKAASIENLVGGVLKYDTNKQQEIIEERKKSNSKDKGKEPV